MGSINPAAFKAVLTEMASSTGDPEAFDVLNLEPEEPMEVGDGGPLMTAPSTLWSDLTGPPTQVTAPSYTAHSPNTIGYYQFVKEIPAGSFVSQQPSSVASVSADAKSSSLYAPVDSMEGIEDDELEGATGGAEESAADQGASDDAEEASNQEGSEHHSGSQTAKSKRRPRRWKGQDKVGTAQASAQSSHTDVASSHGASASESEAPAGQKAKAKSAKRRHSPAGSSSKRVQHDSSQLFALSNILAFL